MLEIYKTKDNVLEELQDFEEGAWINVVEPTQEEILLLSNKLNIEEDFIKAALDEEERARIEVDEGQTLIVVDVPFIERSEEANIYTTMPLGIILTQDATVTIALRETSITKDFLNKRVKGFYTNFKHRFVLQILYRTAYTFLRYLRHIDRITGRVEQELYKSMGNEELYDLMAISKSLVYFSSSLTGNELVLEKMLKLDYIKKYPDDMELLEDVIIENKQAIEMTNIYSNILGSTMDACASIISNNLNNVMKFLTSVTILLSIPTMVSSFYGMNVHNLPFANNPYAFWIVMLIAVLISMGPIIYLYRRKMF